ncbi:low affinity immunoglobulin gamma Fc region receptor III-A-like isoform X2 [Centroberyx affinis]|uniref:low affinity immunoglobulin gamma Fc region receptor III-A-like isoform X2 n=1 Tax=Centroberyx affinis TaxID=166261 RepID=UPI003A5C2726
MKAASLCLLLLLNSLDSGDTQVSLSVTPDSSQFFKYDSFSLSCEEEEEQREEEESSAAWTVMKRMEDGEVESCPSSSCSIMDAYPSTDSGVYWCETGLGETSNSVNITVTAGSVILESPVHPVMEGDAVTLRCRTQTTPSNLPADYYKDGFLIRTGSTGEMTIHNVSKSDEGLYKCNISGVGESPESWLAVRAPPPTAPPPAALLSVSRLMCHLAVGTPYLLSTIILGLIFRDRRRGHNLVNTAGSEVRGHSTLTIDGVNIPMTLKASWRRSSR